MISLTWIILSALENVIIHLGHFCSHLGKAYTPKLSINKHLVDIFQITTYSLALNSYIQSTFIISQVLKARSMMVSEIQPTI